MKRDKYYDIEHTVAENAYIFSSKDSNMTNVERWEKFNPIIYKRMEKIAKEKFPEKTISNHPMARGEFDTPYIQLDREKEFETHELITLEVSKSLFWTANDPEELDILLVKQSYEIIDKGVYRE